MRYSTYNAIPQYPKSKKHPYETLEKERVLGKMKKEKPIIDFLIGAGTGTIISCFFSPNSTIRTVSIVVGVAMVCIGRYKKSKSDKMVFQYIEDHD